MAPDRDISESRAVIGKGLRLYADPVRSRCWPDLVEFWLPEGVEHGLGGMDSQRRGDVFGTPSKYSGLERGYKAASEERTSGLRQECHPRSALLRRKLSGTAGRGDGEECVKLLRYDMNHAA